MPEERYDLSRPILHEDPETGEIITGGADNPTADAQRAEHEAKLRDMMRDRYKNAAPVDAQPYDGDTLNRLCTVGPDDAPGALAAANSDLQRINTSQPGE
jgi:hypothetical protein